MEHTFYERPREKLRSRGATYLSLVELIQLIIGSGTVNISAARLAKKVVRHIEDSSLSFESLIAMPGLGEAKVCQLLAAVELGKRLNHSAHVSHSFSNSVFDRYLEEANTLPKATVCIWFDGSNREIDRKVYPFNAQRQSGIFVRNLFSDALAASARAVLVLLYRKGVHLEPESQDLILLGLIKESSKILQIGVIEVIATNGKSSKKWGQEV